MPENNKPQPIFTQKPADKPKVLPPAVQASLEQTKQATQAALQKTTQQPLAKAEPQKAKGIDQKEVGKKGQAIKAGKQNLPAELPEPESGQIVAHGSTFFGDSFRCFLEKADADQYLVQEFNSNEGKKSSDPYLITDKTALYKNFFNYWKHREAPIEGEYKLWSNQDQKQLQGRYKNGKKQGLWSYWNIDGHKLVEEFYIQGELDGPWKRWSYGSKLIEGHYTEGKKSGEWQHWWFNGQLSARGEYRTGLPTGKWTWWRKDGVRLVEGKFQSGRKVGLWKRWSRNGDLVGQRDYSKNRVDLVEQLQKHGIEIDWDKTFEQKLLIRERIEIANLYDNLAPNYSREFLGVTPAGQYIVRDYYFAGDEKFTDPYVLLTPQSVRLKEFDFWSSRWQIDGAYIQWHPNGRKAQKMNFKNGQRHGYQTNWDNQGRKITEKNFIYDNLSGFYSEWYPNGQMHENRYYMNNIRAGLWTSWWDNGQKKWEGVFQNDLLNGRWNWWHRNGKLYTKGTYKHGYKTGVWQQWDEQSKRISQQTYPTLLKDIPQWLKEEYQIDSAPLKGSENDDSYTPIGFRFTIHDIDYAHSFDRVFWGMTPEGFDIVQDFYWEQGDLPRTAPYLIQDRMQTALLYSEVDDVRRCSIEGAYKQWYATGQPEFSAQMSKGMPVGLWQWWDASGKLLKKINYDATP